MDHATQLIHAVVGNLRDGGDDWESLAMVLELDGHTVDGTYGYLYSSSGGTPTATSMSPALIEDAVSQYVACHADPAERMPVKILVQFDRTSGASVVTLEARNSARWSVTPRNYEAMREELRPHLDTPEAS